MLAEAPDWPALTARPSFFGNPLLFPFAYGIAGGTLRYGGAAYPLRATRWGRVAHGLVRDHAWKVERAWTDGAGDHLSAVISTDGDAGRLEEYPFPFRLAVTYSLSGTTLRLHAVATNPGPQPLPFGFGIHPYISTPLDPAGSMDDDVVVCDAPLASPAPAPRAAQPDGELVPVADVAGGAFDLRQGKSVSALLAAQRAQRPNGGLYVSYARRPLAGEAKQTAAESAGGLHWALHNRRLGLAVEIEASDDLRAMVLFAPVEPTKVISPVICTCLPSFFELAEQGRPSGLLELAPGQQWTATVTLRVRPVL